MACMRSKSDIWYKMTHLAGTAHVSRNVHLLHSERTAKSVLLLKNKYFQISWPFPSLVRAISQ